MSSIEHPSSHFRPHSHRNYEKISVYIRLGAVQNIGVSFSKIISCANCVLGVGTRILSPSSKRSMSCHGKIRSLHRKSLRKIISASSTPTQAKVPLAGFTKASNMSHKGLSMKVFPQLAGPVIKIFRPFPRPLLKAFLTASLSSFLEQLFRSNVCDARRFHSSSHPETHFFFRASSKICSLL